jgi:hypothetical protein
VMHPRGPICRYLSPAARAPRCAVRRCIEEMDHYEGCVLLHRCHFSPSAHEPCNWRADLTSAAAVLRSLSGGTGAGLGTRLAEEIRETYPVQVRYRPIPAWEGRAAGLSILQWVG